MVSITLLVLGIVVLAALAFIAAASPDGASHPTSEARPTDEDRPAPDDTGLLIAVQELRESSRPLWRRLKHAADDGVYWREPLAYGCSRSTGRR